MKNPNFGFWNSRNQKGNQVEIYVKELYFRSRITYQVFSSKKPRQNCLYGAPKFENGRKITSLEFIHCTRRTINCDCRLIHAIAKHCDTTHRDRKALRHHSPRSQGVSGPRSVRNYCTAIIWAVCVRESEGKREPRSRRTIGVH